MKRIGLVVATLLLAAGLTGCAAPPKPLYHWGGYQAQVYEHFKGDGKGPLEQLAALEAEQQKARASGATLPPGYLAHMGLLSMKLGRSLAWDGARDQILNDPDANKLLRREYRGSWKYPEA